MSLLSLSTTPLFDEMARIMRAGHVPMVRSSPGQGKSSVVRQLAEHFGLKLIDIRLAQCEPSDLLGFPQIINGKATYVPMDTFPLENDPLPPIDPNDPSKGNYQGWLIFFDEMPDAPPSLQSLAYKIILDKMVGNHKLHKKVMMAAAGNHEENAATAHAMSTALQSRLIHLDLVTSLEDFIKNARKNNFDTRVIAFLNFQPDLLDNFKPDHADHTFACCRTWEFASDFIKSIPMLDYTILPTLAGTLGEGVAQQFFAFTQIYRDLPTIQEITTNPLNARVPTEPSAKFAVSDLVYNHLTVATAPTLLPYLERLDIEFQILVLREFFNNNIQAAGDPVFAPWLVKNTARLNP